VGLALSYVPVLVGVAAVGAVIAWGGSLSMAFWLLVALLVGYAYIFAIARSQRLQHRGVQATREDQPELMAVVDDVMERAGIRRLDGVWLTSGAGAGALIGRRDWLGRRHVGVTIGLLTAAHLGVQELAAILAHEAGHLTDPRHLRLLLGARRRYARTKLERWAARLSWWYWRWFLGLTREQGLDIERNADAVAAQMCGTEAAWRAYHRAYEAGIVHDLAVTRFVRPWWERRIAPATLFEAYEAVWKRTPEMVVAGIDERMSAAYLPQDTHPGLAERCRGQRFPLPPALRGDLPLARLEELDRRCTASLTQQHTRQLMTTLSWPEIKALAGGHGKARDADKPGSGVTPARR
jgi:Zn-dependent protease with chaperone function